jgi:hypothetical protein
MLRIRILYGEIQVKTFVAAVFCFCSIAAVAATESANINRGDIRIGGGVGIGYSTYSSTIVTVSPLVQYFVADGFAVGLDTDYSFSKREDIFAAGPIASYYFWTREAWAAFVEQRFKYHTSKMYGPSSYETKPYWSSTSSLGANYFMSKYVAIGPALTYFVRLNQIEGQEDTGSAISLTGAISVYF